MASPFAFMALGDGRHKLAVKRALLQALEDVGDEVTIHLDERIA
jgi:hypothetical protein